MQKFLKLCLVSFLSILMPVAVWADDVYVISGVPVAGEADSATAAREQALQKGKKEAFRKLLDTVVAVADRGKVFIDEQQVESFVQDISVVSEKASSTKYYGTLTVRFKAPEIRQRLENAKVSFLSRLPQPFIVIPIYKNAQGVSVFSENNPLFKAMQNGMPASNLFTFQAITGDAADEELAVRGVLNQDRQALISLAKKYYVSQILILKIVKQNTQYAVSTTVWPSGTAPEAEVSFKISDDRESENRICADLLQDTLRAMTKKWVYLTQNTAQPITVYQVIVPIKKVSDLSRMRQKLSQLNFADKVDIKGLSNKQLTVDFHYRGSVAELGEKLRLNQLILTIGADAAGQPLYQLTEADGNADANTDLSSFEEMDTLKQTE